jgi:hypothetical protein
VSNRSRICRCVAALDYWYAHRIPPVDQPSPGTPLYRFIVRWIVDSWNIPVGVAQYFTWMNLPDADTGFDVLGRHVTVDQGVSGRTAAATRRLNRIVNASSAPYSCRHPRRGGRSDPPNLTTGACLTALPDLPTTAVSLGAMALAPAASWPGSLLSAHLATQQKNDAVGPAL